MTSVDLQNFVALIPLALVLGRSDRGGLGTALWGRQLAGC